MIPIGKSLLDSCTYNTTITKWDMKNKYKGMQYK